METSKRGAAILSRHTLMLYSVAAFGTNLLYYPVVVLLPQLYIKEIGLSIGGVGLVITLTQVLDAINQQILGLLSDRTRTRWGPRKPWIAFGATLAVVASFFLLRPPPGIGLLYFALWRIVYDFAWTAKTVAYSAWGAELSNEYRTRSRVLGSAALSTQLGSISNNLFPIVIAGIGLAATSNFSMQMMGYYFVAGAILVPLLHAVTLIGAPQGIAMAPERPTILGMVQSVKQNRPFWRYLATFLLTWLATGTAQISFIFYDSYLHIGKWLPYMFTGLAVATLVSIPFWVWLSNAIGKHKAYCYSLIFTGAGMLAFWLIDPKTDSEVVIVGISTLVDITIGIGAGCGLVATGAILGDIVDYGTWKTGVRRTASYFAFYLLTTKVATALGAGLSFMVLSLFGYDAKPGTTNTQWADTGILFVFAFVPTVLRFSGAAILWRFPLNERRHDIIRRRLEQRAEREGRQPGLRQITQEEVGLSSTAALTT